MEPVSEKLGYRGMYGSQERVTNQEWGTSRTIAILYLKFHGAYADY